MTVIKQTTVQEEYKYKYKATISVKVQRHCPCSRTKFRFPLEQRVSGPSGLLVAER